MRFNRILSFVLAASAALPACSSEELGVGEVLVTSVVEIDPPGAGIRIGTTKQLTATPKTASGIPIPNREVVWFTSNHLVATVSNTGLVRAVSPGRADITAEVDQVSATVPVNVTPKPVAEVLVQPASASLVAGQSRQLQVTLRAADGSTLSNRAVTYQSDNPTVATVSNAGLVAGIAAGQTVVRVRSEGKEDRSDITVTSRPAARVRFTVQPANGIVGQSLSPIKVAVQDAIGGRVANATSPVTVALGNNPGNATLSGTLTVNAVGGVATFSNLKLNRAGSGYTLRATSGALSPGSSGSFTVVAGDPASLAITTQPSSTAVSGQRLQQQPVVQLKDQEGNDVAKAGIEIEVTLQGSDGKLSGSLKVNTDANGRARFTDLQISGAGTYRLRFRGHDLDSVESRSIVVTVNDDHD